MTGTRIYQGWRYTFGQDRPAKARWVATKDGAVLDAPSEAAIKKHIDNALERASRLYGSPLMEPA